VLRSVVVLLACFRPCTSSIWFFDPFDPGTSEPALKVEPDFPLPKLRLPGNRRRSVLAVGRQHTTTAVIVSAAIHRENFALFLAMSVC